MEFADIFFEVLLFKIIFLDSEEYPILGLSIIKSSFEIFEFLGKSLLVA